MARLIVPDSFEGLPLVTAEEMKRIDRRAMEDFGISPLTLMENAGKGVAEGVLGWLEERGVNPKEADVVVCCGRGNNGGDGLVAARYLKTSVKGVWVFIAAAKEDRPYSMEVSENLGRARQAGVPVVVVEKDLEPLERALASATVVLDALLGTGSTGKPAGTVHKMIQAVTRSRKPVIAVDIPSGLQPDTGYHSGAFISASLTLTLGLPKKGLLATHAQRNVGKLKVVDIGLPQELLRRPGSRD